MNAQDISAFGCSGSLGDHVRLGALNIINVQRWDVAEGGGFKDVNQQFLPRAQNMYKMVLPFDSSAFFCSRTFLVI